MFDLVHSPQNPRLLLEPILRSSEPATLAVLRIGLTRPTPFTDLIGPRYATAVLNVGIDRIKAALHSEDALFRLDQDELMIILNPIRSAQDAAQLTNDIIGLLQQPYFCRGKSARLHASAGIALSSSTGKNVDALLQCAEFALRYAQSSRSEAAIVYGDELQTKLNSRKTLSRDLSKVLESAQLKVFYQPQFSIDRRRIVGFSTQLHWKHPELGWISPADFIPLAEEIGILDNIATWTLRTVCREAVFLRPEFVVAVKSYPLQFRTGEIIDSVTSALNKTGLPPERLAIELTETFFLDESKLVESAIAFLHNMGVKLVLADFGASFSSLDLISRVPFSTINLNSNLVGQSSQQRSIVRAAAMLGRELGISTLAEGIETEEDLIDAEIDGCTCAQGPFLGRAIRAADLDAIVAPFNSRRRRVFIQ